LFVPQIEQNVCHTCQSLSAPVTVNLLVPDSFNEMNRSTPDLIMNCPELSHETFFPDQSRFFATDLHSSANPFGSVIDSEKRRVARFFAGFP